MAYTIYETADSEMPDHLSSFQQHQFSAYNYAFQDVFEISMGNLLRLVSSLPVPSGLTDLTRRLASVEYCSC